MSELANKLRDGDGITSDQWDDVKLSSPGFYSIFVDDPSSLPPGAFSEAVRERSNLLYVGIASKSLARRLLQQDLMHRGASTFFRSLGAVLECRPVEGSLIGQANQYNYVFSAADTLRIQDWIRAHVTVRVVEHPNPSHSDEREAIIALRPLLNLTHNPSKLPELEDLRAECRRIALKGV